MCSQRCRLVRDQGTGGYVHGAHPPALILPRCAPRHGAEQRAPCGFACAVCFGMNNARAAEPPFTEKARRTRRLVIRSARPASPGTSPPTPRAEGFIQGTTALVWQKRGARPRLVVRGTHFSRWIKIRARPRAVRCLKCRGHGTRFETMAILVKALKCVTKRLRAFP